MSTENASAPKDSSHLRRYLPQPLRQPLRRMKARLVAARERLSYIERCIAGEDCWLRTDVRRRTLRLGQGDGSWTVCPDDLPANPIVYSFGLGTDISFDLAAIERLGATVFGFDPTPLSIRWLQAQALPERFTFTPWGLAAHDGTIQLALPENHAVSFTSLAQSAVTARVTCDVKTLATIMARLGHARIDILKMDIEGCEYEVVPDIAACGDKIGQVLMEVHHRMIGGADGLAKTRMAVKRLRDAGYALYHISPRGLEYSFVRRDARRSADLTSDDNCPR